jgi:branched-chain amino acid transport system ATP-binding protein
MVCIPGASRQFGDSHVLEQLGHGDMHHVGEGLGVQAHGQHGHGQQRQLEIAMCLATAPTVLLLDEPLAGMGAEETERMLSLLEGLRAGHAIVLVEHDMDAVFRVADRVTVMVNGQVIATDRPEGIRNNAAVKTAYLGDHDAAH